MFSLKSLLKRSKRRPNHTFTDEDREQASEMRSLNAEIRRIDMEFKKAEKQMELDAKREELELVREERMLRLQKLRGEMLGGDDSEDGPDMESMLLMQVLAPMLQSMQGGQQSAPFVEGIQPSPGVPRETVQHVTLTDDEIRGVITQLPKKYVKMAKSMDDSLLQKALHSQMPNLAPETAERAVALFRAEF